MTTHENGDQTVSENEARCPAVHFSNWGIVRCTKTAGHRDVDRRPDVWHSGPGQYIDEGGEPEVYGSAWRYMPELTR